MKVAPTDSPIIREASTDIDIKNSIMIKIISTINK